MLSDEGSRRDALEPAPRSEIDGDDLERHVLPGRPGRHAPDARAQGDRRTGQLAELELDLLPAAQIERALDPDARHRHVDRGGARALVASTDPDGQPPRRALRPALAR